MTIQEVSRAWVHPRPPVDASLEVPLSDLDAIQVPFHMPVLIVYRSGEMDDGGEVPLSAAVPPPSTRLLKDSLAQTLAAYFTLGGRIRASNGRLLLHGFNEGVPFLEATSDMDLPPNAHLQPSHFSTDLLATPVSASSGTPLGAPVLTVKVTHFRCGGLVIGISFHHQVVDASAFFQFMNAWASIARGKTPRRPHLDRAVLIDRQDRMSAVPQDVSRLQQKTSSCYSSALGAWQQHSSFWRAYAGLRWRSLGRPQGLLRITFSRAEVQCLKRRANEECSETWDCGEGGVYSSKQWASSDDALCAHMWQRITHARALPREAVVTFDRHVDMRTRLDPPLPPCFVGSGNVGPPRISVTAGHLLSMTLGHVAQKLRRNVLQMDEGYLRGVLHRFESAAFLPHFIARAPPFGTAVRVTSWTKFLLYDVDFGWGRPRLVTLSLLPPFFDGVLELQQTPEGDGGLDAIVLLQEEHLRRLQQDPNLHPKGL